MAKRVGPTDEVSDTGISGFALAAFVMAIIFFSLPWMFIPQILTVVFAIIGLIRINKHGMRGKWFAIVALIIAILHILIAIYAIASIATILPNTDFQEMMKERVQSFVEDKVMDEMETRMSEELGNEIEKNIEEKIRDEADTRIAEEIAKSKG